MLNFCIQLNLEKIFNVLLNVGVLKYFKWHIFHLWSNNPIFNAESNSVLGFSWKQVLIVSCGQRGLETK